jgi:hypothetical protein
MGQPIFPIVLPNYFIKIWVCLIDDTNKALYMLVIECEQRIFSPCTTSLLEEKDYVSLMT